MDMKNIQWYPGHMKKALREIEENIRLIDVVIEILDARIPYASKNPDINRFALNKQRVVVLNKEDLADKEATKEWQEYFKDKGYFCVSINSKDQNSIKKVSKVVNMAGEKKRERDRKRGINNRPVRTLVCGIPNSGKSTFINSYVGKKSTKTGDRPGVTKGKQWIRLTKDVEMLDTPGILWPKFEDQNTGELLAICGSIRDEILNKEDICIRFLEKMKEIDAKVIEQAYSVEYCEEEQLLYNITKNRNFLKQGAMVDTERGANAILDDFRSGKLGRITLERVRDYERNF